MKKSRKKVICVGEFSSNLHCSKHEGLGLNVWSKLYDKCMIKV